MYYFLLVATKEAHSPRVFFSIIVKLLSRSAFSTSSAFSRSIPEEINSPPGFMKSPIHSDKGMITSASILATAMSTCPLHISLTGDVSSSILAFIALILSGSMWFIEAFSMVASTAQGSISRQYADFAPQRSDDMASIPLPHPASRIVVVSFIFTK